MKIVNSIPTQALRLDYIFKLIYALLFLFLLYLLLTDQLSLRWIPTNTKGLIKMGFIESTTGNVFRQLNGDSLHLPLIDNDIVYQEDLIITQEDSSAIIQFNSKNKITTEANTTIRLSSNKDGLNIHIQKGNVITDFVDDAWVSIKNGVKNDKIQIRKGTYFIKNSGAGIQITTYNDSAVIKKGITQNKREKKMRVQPNSNNSSAIDNNDSESTSMASNADEIDEEMFDEGFDKKNEILLELPHPEDKMLYLVKNIQPIIIAAKAQCQGRCKFQLFKEKTLIIEKLYTQGQITQYVYNFEESDFGHFNWHYEDLEDSMDFSFDIFKFSNEALNKALAQGQNIEIL